jgi:hypothetical protein|tara:strand:- start:5316 stop:5681 length:366 start_codon:yes stop_codon:yes gene_type:complete
MNSTDEGTEMKEMTVELLRKHLMDARDQDDYEVQQDIRFPLSPRITCADGFSLSVQASHGAYCRPRTNIADWYEVEVGYPSEAPTAFISYAEDQDKPTDTVYGYVPIELVVAEINRHGGIA